MAFNLPSKFVLHTVGLIINKSVIENDCSLLADCYRSCLEFAKKKRFKIGRILLHHHW
ncbi:macro domain-containing protein [Haemophilus paraphrohaemolyticus]|uniref:macro domain-containing protein n=1 Tax=Haemophilus paraphrohaemolyticus TaxID=736 RepID=UPI001E465DE1|nr:macro domain-containing protein [Haemophilus paraphrohaemolyticus]